MIPCTNKKINLGLDESSISDGEANSQGDNTCYKSSSVSNNSALVNFGGVCGKRSDGSGESSDGSDVFGVLDLTKGFWKLAGSKGLHSRCLGHDGGEGRGASHKDGDKEKLESLHCVNLRYAREEEEFDVRRGFDCK